MKTKTALYTADIVCNFQGPYIFVENNNNLQRIPLGKTGFQAIIKFLDEIGDETLSDPQDWGIEYPAHQPEKWWREIWQEWNFENYHEYYFKNCPIPYKLAKDYGIEKSEDY